SRFLLLEYQALDDGRAAELGAHAVDRVFGRGAAPAAGVDEVVRVGRGAGLQLRQANADQAEPGAVGLALEQVAGGREDPGRQRGRRAQAAGTGADAEIGALELQRHGRARQVLGLEAGRDLFAQAPQALLELAERGDVGLEGRLGGDALGLAVGAPGAVVDARPKLPQA